MASSEPCSNFKKVAMKMKVKKVDKIDSFIPKMEPFSCFKDPEPADLITALKIKEENKIPIYKSDIFKAVIPKKIDLGISRMKLTTYIPSKKSNEGVFGKFKLDDYQPPPPPIIDPQVKKNFEHYEEYYRLLRYYDVPQEETYFVYQEMLKTIRRLKISDFFIELMSFEIFKIRYFELEDADETFSSIGRLCESTPCLFPKTSKYSDFTEKQIEEELNIIFRGVTKKSH